MSLIRHVLVRRAGVERARENLPIQGRTPDRGFDDNSPVGLIKAVGRVEKGGASQLVGSENRLDF
jgi:hypothetical protein